MLTLKNRMPKHGEAQNLFLAFSESTPCMWVRQHKRAHPAEVDAIIFWLTGYDADGLAEVLNDDWDFTRFAGRNPLRQTITGVVCGVRVEHIEETLMQEIRYLDKLVDELAKGKPMSKILRG